MRGVVIVPLMAALLLAVIILVIKDPAVDRSRNSEVIGISEFVVMADLIVFVAGFFAQAALRTRLVKVAFGASIVCMLLLMATCPPNLTVRAIFTQMSSEQK